MFMKEHMFRERKFLTPILLSLVVMPMMATDIYLPIIPAMGEWFGVSSQDITNTLTVYMLGYSLSLLLAGILADIYGRRMISIAGLGIFFIASVGCYFASSVNELVFWRFFQAAGGGCGTLLARIIVRDIYEPQSQVRVLSYLAAGLVLSPILGPIFGAHIGTHFGWQAIFLVLAGLSFLVLLLVSFFMKESRVDYEALPSFSLSLLISRYLSLWGNREFVFHTLVISFGWAVYFAFLSSSPTLIQGFYKVDPVEYGYIFSLTISGFILGTIFIRWKIATLNLRHLIFIAGAIILASSLILHVLARLDVGTLETQLLLVFFSLFGIGIIFPATQAGVTTPFKSHIGFISSLFYSTEMFFGAVCGYILSCMGAVNWITTSLIMLIAAIGIVLISLLDKCYSLSLSSQISEL